MIRAKKKESLVVALSKDFMVGHGPQSNGKICFGSKRSVVLFLHCFHSIKRHFKQFRLKRWGMDSYVYAPKDDYKHRAYWREMYTVEEADHLTSML